MTEEPMCNLQSKIRLLVKSFPKRMIRISFLNVVSNKEGALQLIRKSCQPN